MSNLDVFPVDLGDVPNDGTGDPLRVAFAKINDNFDYLANLAPNGPEGAVQFIRNGVSGGEANLVYNEAAGNLDIGLNLVPLADSSVDLGARSNRFSQLYLSNSGAVIGNVTLSESGNTVSFTYPGIPNIEPASISSNNISVSGNAEIQGSLTVGNKISGVVEVDTFTDEENQIVYQAPVQTIDTASFQITTRDPNDTTSQVVTLDVLKATSNVSLRYTAHGTIFSGGPLTRYNADVAYGNVRIMVSPMINTEMHHIVNYTINT